MLTRIAIVLAIVIGWESLARSGLLYRDVVPPLPLIGRELAMLLIDRGFYHNLAVTFGEVALAVAIGGGAGVLVGIVLGRDRFLSSAYEPLLHYLGPTPKIIFFPIMIMWFGVGPGSKVAMGALSCFFPVAVSVAASMREIDRVLIRVGMTFRLTSAQMLTKIYIPAMRLPVINGIRIGLGVAIVGTLLAETKLANQGLGYAVIQTYTTFNMPRMYALLLIVFLLAVGVNSVLGRYTEVRMAKSAAMAELDRGKPAASAASPIPLAYVIAALPPLFWAGNFLIARMMRDDIPPIQMSFWRWVLALAIMLPFAWSSLRLDRSRLLEEWPFLALLGAIGVTAFNCFIYTALHHTTVINAALVNSLLPVVTIILAWVLLGERIFPLRALGITVSLVGAVLVIARGDLLALGDLEVGRGDILVVLGMSFWALYMVLVRRRPLGLKPLSLLGATTVFGIVLHLPFVLVETTASGIFVPTLHSLPALIYFAIFPSILAYVFWNRSIATLGPATTGMFMHLMPIFSAILAAVLLGERLAWYHPVAFIVIVGGILLTTRRPSATPQPNHQKR